MNNPAREKFECWLGHFFSNSPASARAVVADIKAISRAADSYAEEYAAERVREALNRLLSKRVEMWDDNDERSYEVVLAGDIKERIAELAATQAKEKTDHE